MPQPHCLLRHQQLARYHYHYHFNSHPVGPPLTKAIKKEPKVSAFRAKRVFKTTGAAMLKRRDPAALAMRAVMDSVKLEK